MTGTVKSSTGISTSAVLYSVQPAYACPSASPFLSIGIASRRATTNPVQTCFFGVNEKGIPCTNEKEFSDSVPPPPIRFNRGLPVELERIGFRTPEHSRPPTEIAGGTEESR